MARVCQVTGKRPVTGNKVSHSNIKTKPAKQLFLKQLEIFIKFNFDTFLDEDSEFKLPPFLRSEYLRGFFKRLKPGSKLYKKTKSSLLNLYYDLLVDYLYN